MQILKKHFGGCFVITINITTMIVLMFNVYYVEEVSVIAKSFLASVLQKFVSLCAITSEMGNKCIVISNTYTIISIMLSASISFVVVV